MHGMDADTFAERLAHAYREIYRHAVRRVDDGRDALAGETTALLLHLAQAGPSTLTELARHFGRALSTLSVKVDGLEADGLLARQRDDDDARRLFVWLTPLGRRRLLDALEVLDIARLARAAARIDPTRRRALLDGLDALLAALSVADEGDPS